MELKANPYGRKILDELPQQVLEEVVAIKKEPNFHTSKIITYFGVILCTKPGEEFIGTPDDLSRFCKQNYEYLKDRCKSALIRLYLVDRTLD